MDKGSHLRGRVLVVGDPGRRQRTADTLTELGFVVGEALVEEAAQLAGVLSPEAVVLAGGPDAESVLRTLKANESMRAVPLLVEASDAVAGASSLRAAGADELIPAGSETELRARVDAAVRAKRLGEREQASRRRLEALVEIAQAATSTLMLEEILGIVVEKIAQVVTADRCSVVLIEEDPPRAVVVASREVGGVLNLELDLERYPELRKALQTGEAVLVQDALDDPLMDGVRELISPIDVRSILVQPLVSQDDVVGALFLRLSRREDAFGDDEVDFARAAASAIANSVRNARLHAAVRRKRDELESAYVDRYRELIEANERLKEANRLKDEIIAVCSHDLRGPLNVLMGHARLLDDGTLGRQQQASVDAILRQSNKVLRLVESLLDKGRGEAVRIAFEPGEVDVAAICSEVAGEVEILAADRGVSIEVRAEDPVPTLADGLKLRQVMQNLLTNAIAHAREGGRVLVQASKVTRPQGEEVRVEVTDDGEGIPPEQLPLVFDRYRHGPGGIGLGLSICREFVELHGGEIWASSGPGGGCTFTFTLPVSDTRLPNQRLNPPAPERQRILLVEDEPEVAMITSEMLRSKYRVDVARDGAEGIAKARTLAPDLIVMDVFLPKVDGLDAVAALKGAADTRDIPVILLSAHQGIAEKVRALNLGAVDYLAKPFQSSELLARVQRALDARQTVRRLEKTEEGLRRAGFDPSTGLLDHHGFIRRFAQELSRARRYRRTLSLSVLLPSRNVSPAAANSAAAALRSALRSSDVLGHLGEGRFAVLLPEADPQLVEGLVPRLSAAASRAFGCSVRVGTLDAGPGERGPEELLVLAGSLAVEE